MFAEKNSIYLIAGYIVFLGGISTYLLSLVLRRRNLRRDEAMLEQIAQQLKEEASQAPSPQPSPVTAGQGMPRSPQDGEGPEVRSSTP